MKLLLSVWLSLGALVLGGCAAPAGPNATNSADPTDAAPVAVHKPVYPTGALQPITAGSANRLAVAPLAPPADLWERIRRGFAMEDLNNDLVRDREQWYSTRPDYIQRMTERSSKYLFHIVEELERRGMPTELALLPYIESAFNPQAVSSAKAAGMWQFMPATGNDYQLKQNMFRDDRRDVLASTRAALDYLQRLYGMFGDWQLALAAYNWGEGSVGRAIAKNQKAGLPTGYEDITMPAETRMYVPKLQAVKNIVAHPEQFNAELPLIENHPYFQQVEITRDIDIALAAKLAGVKLEDFKALNPSMRHPVILAAGTTNILLPWDNAAVFRRNLDAYSDGQYASWTAWTVPATLSVTAAAAKVGMSEQDLRAVNGIPPRMVIKAGSTLVVPRTSSMQDDVDADVAESGKLALAPEIVTKRTVVKAGRRDSVATVAKRYSVATSDVANWNSVSPSTTFKAGQQLIVYLPVRPHAPSGSPSARGPARNGHVAARAVVKSGPAAKAPAAKARAAAPAKRKR
ncbi:transglycosylase SLT domain-containing protein [Xylophilus sp. GOD-11R]|uniref:transglycosylase SLT domain-containing protein n=1 Tax=Xylophilus sp. GOD-11R TaxID=3089814 RepID=UPI00298C6F09|nr:transglycosylase SLT domain-containing protein [Xylophilus sp. GOD-11R]WPB58758.1 transglycosylase SLT domain-containing protein [Xylophilus sp. GOD-11R]